MCAFPTSPATVCAGWGGTSGWVRLRSAPSPAATSIPPCFPTDRRVLELGCGLGLLGACLHRIGAGPLTLTDGNARTVANCCSNLLLNDVPAILITDPAASIQLPGSRTDLDPERRVAPDPALAGVPMRTADGREVQCCRLQWGSLSEGGGAAAAGSVTSAVPSPRPDIILGADLLYDPGRCLRLLRPHSGGSRYSRHRPPLLSIIADKTDCSQNTGTYAISLWYILSYYCLFSLLARRDHPRPRRRARVPTSSASCIPAAIRRCGLRRCSIPFNAGTAGAYLGRWRRLQCGQWRGW